MNEIATCPHCGKPLRIEAVTEATRPAPASQQRDANGNLLPMPWTLERAERFTMPFGKHEGRTIAEIDRIDRNYLKWLAETCDRNVQRAAITYLEATPSRPQPA